LVAVREALRSGIISASPRRTRRDTDKNSHDEAEKAWVPKDVGDALRKYVDPPSAAALKFNSPFQKGSERFKPCRSTIYG
jgi:hypothetical protein